MTVKYLICDYCELTTYFTETGLIFFFLVILNLLLNCHVWLVTIILNSTVLKRNSDMSLRNLKYINYFAWELLKAYEDD